MEIQIAQHGNAAVVAVIGRLDSVTAAEFHRKMRGLVDSGTARIVVDFGELTYISSAGLGELVRTAKLLQEKDGRFCLANVDAKVLSLIDICGIGSLLQVHSSVPQALAAIA
jgi:anti-anti-sigma factor